MRVLLVVKNMRLSNGVSSYAMNYYRQLVCDKFNYDFLVVNDVESPYYAEIKKSGGKVFLMPSYKKEPLKVIPYLKKVFKENQFDVVHCNVMNSGSLILMMAKICGVKVRILHSHATQTGDKAWKKIRNKLFCSITLKCSNTYFACSHLAGDYLFGKNNYFLIPNAIEIGQYKFSSINREEIRNTLGIGEFKVIMTVGRFTHQKNPFFIVDIIKQYSKTHKDFVFWWFGNGELEEKVKEYATNQNIIDKIIFWGARADVNKYYSAADVFILPSLYEGLPVVGIEAQIAALPIVFSDNISKEAKISNNVEFENIKDPMVWCSTIDNVVSKDRVENEKSVKFFEWDISKQAEKLAEIYNKLINRETKK